MTTPTERNRLDEEESPYLLDHAENPVNWQPWDEQAREAAKEHDVPIFLSSGYAACHWCHVMADESFEDEEIATKLNENFVPVKLDREERPDVDRIYQTICQQVTGRGGWPLSVWLTPDGRPFYVGTYFPKTAQRGMPGFGELLDDISDSWSDSEERKELQQRADEWTKALEGEVEEVPSQSHEPEDVLMERAAKAAVRAADREYGGWGSGPKFPQTGRLQLLARADERTERDVYREVLTETLDAMANGGMYDHIGGGFHRYATDRDWTVPHFEKMLYDNAELPKLYLAGYQITGDERYATVATQTLDFVQRELTHEEGGFFSTLDAQSSDEDGSRTEGAYYVWTPSQIETAVEDERDAELFCERYGVTDRGNFEGKTVLTLSQTIEQLADEFGMETEAVTEALERAREQVANARDQRARPPRDEKILASWNGLMISAFARAGIVLDESFTEPAREALAFVQDELWDPLEEELQRRYTDGVTKIDGYLEDYAYLARGAFDLYQATREPEYLGFALDLAWAMERQFYDEDAGTLYFTPDDGESLVARPQELTDQSTPSSVGVATELFSQLSHFTLDDVFADLANTVVETHGNKVKANPLQHASLTLAADTVVYGTLEIALLADEPPEEWLSELRDQYIGSHILAWRPRDEDDFEAHLETLGLTEAPPIWADRGSKSEQATLYVCRAQTCSPPRTEMDTALGWADRLL